MTERTSNKVLLLYAAEHRYHSTHATHMGAYQPTCGALPYLGQYHPAHIGYDGGRQSWMDSLSPSISSRARGSRMDRMDLDRHGLRYLCNSGISLRPGYSHKYLGWTRRNPRLIPLQCNKRDRKFCSDSVRWEGIFSFVSGERASTIPPSQSSIPFFIRKTLILTKPASVNQTVTSSAG